MDELIRNPFAVRRPSRTPGRRAAFAALSVAALVVLNGATSLAHDFWIEPTTFTPLAGSIVGARLRVGQELVGDPVPRSAALVEQFIADDGDGRRPLIGREGTDPAGLLRASSPGLLVVGYRSSPSPLALSPDQFDQFIREEGLDHVAALRTRRPQPDRAREVFVRCAKSLLLVGTPDPRQRDRSLGFTLELIAERNPYAMAPGQVLPVRLIYEDRPLAGALVVAMNRTAPFERLTARTGRDGRVSFQLSRGGMWMIKAVHLIPARAPVPADWESFWASLTFQVPEAANAVASTPR